ncbi:hypothetical protein AcW1_008502 [Taiwanofungus camphoratus]|nr:hypothetical protein AcV5_008792 [Antrodia cinnamomea]KAI0951463.1 hypothetical protein AcW1_008502 [Antrodia cinnamomea]KAI0956364.1 hypothetical protein AcV7_006788 [Antrodia cinnamomea]
MDQSSPSRNPGDSYCRSHENDASSLHDSIHHPPHGWSSMLEDWYINNFYTNLNGGVHPEMANVTASDPDLLNPNSSEAGSCSKTSPQKSRAGPYELLVKERMMGLYLAVYVNRDVKHLVRGTSKSVVTTGLIGGRVGNKGGVGVSVNIDGTTLLFINAHLAAHGDKVHHRVADFNKIKAELSVDDFLNHADSRCMAEDITDRFDHTFIFGDLNFRLDVTRLHADWLISRKEYAQALAFDQLRNVMASGEAFVGFKEAPITFPPTFKYDVLRTIKRSKRRYSKKDASTPILDGLENERPLPEIQEKDQEPIYDEDAAAEDDCDVDASSLASSMWTSGRSRYTVDGDPTREVEDKDLSIHSLATRPHTSNIVRKMWTAAAVQKAKAKWVSLLSTSTPGTPGHKWKKLKNGLAQRPASVPIPDAGDKEWPKAPSSVNSGRAVSVSALELGHARNQGASYLVENTSSNELLGSVPKHDMKPEYKGVYDSSHKQRVPSWCDRILWKSTVQPDSDPGDEDHRPVHSSRIRISNIFHALRPLSARSRKNSYNSATSVEMVQTGGGDEHYLSTAGADFEEGHGLQIPSTSWNHPFRSPSRMSHTKSIDSLGDQLPSIQTTFRNAEMTEIRPSSRTRSISSPVPLIHAQTMPPVVPINWCNPDGSAEQNTSPQTSTSLSLTAPSQAPPSSRWRGFLPFLHRDASVPATVVLDDTPELHRGRQPRRGDVVCLGYDTLGDRAMRRLEGRSDHRPVIGSYALYL